MIRQPLPFFVFLSCFLALQETSCVSCASEADDIKEFGVKKGEPIVNGAYLFFGHLYIDAPYVVERRGVNIYVNGIFLETAVDRSRQHLQVKDDPGNPPAGSAPAHNGTYIADDYWDMKWRYLATNFSFEEAKRQMVATYRACPEVKSVVEDSPEGKKAAEMVSNDPANPALTLDITLKDGTEIRYIISLAEWRAVRGLNQRSTEEITKWAESARQKWEQNLAQPGGFFLEEGLEIDTGILSLFLKDVMSNDEEETKIQKLAKDLNQELDPDMREWFKDLVEHFRPTPLLVERLKKLDDDLARQEMQRDQLPLIPPFMRAMTQPATKAAGNEPSTKRAVVGVASEAASIKEFGVNKGEPIVAGRFFFLWNRYIDAPYIVERRGLSIYVNGLFMERAGVWPIPDYSEKADLGLPPKGSTPWDPLVTAEDFKKTYWWREYAYLATTLEYEDSVRKMAEVYKQSDAIDSVTPVEPTKDFQDHPDHPNLAYQIVLKNGQKHVVTFTFGQWSMIRGGDPAAEKVALLKRADEMKDSWQKDLSGQGALFNLDSEEIYADPKATAEIIKVLVSADSDDQKIKELKDRKLVGAADDKVLRSMLTGFTPTPLLMERYDALRLQQKLETGNPPPPVPPGFLESATKP